MVKGISYFSWKQILLLVLVLIVGIVFILIFIAKPENDEFKKEKERLAEIENKLMVTIEKGDTTSAKFLIIQLRWQYEPSTIGGQSEADALRKVWNVKRKEYLMLIGEDPNKYDFETEKKGLKSQWEDLINN